MEDLISRKYTRKERIYSFLALFFAALLRFTAYGTQYFLQLDDYIQLILYSQSESPWLTVTANGLLSTRPLAALGDIFVWGKLIMRPLLPMLVIALMLALTAELFRAVMGRYFRVGIAFSAALILIPVNFEGTYWISSSNRIVTAMLFTALSALLLLRFIETGKWYYAPLYCVALLLSVGFYEQLLALSVTVTVLIAASHLIGKKRTPRALLGLAFIPAVMLYFAVCAHFAAPDSATGSRVSMVLPTNSWWHTYVFPTLLGQMKEAILEASPRIIYRGFLRGVQLALSDGKLLFTVCAVVLSALLGSLAYRCSDKQPDSSRRPALLTAAVGVLLTLAPMSVHLIVGEPWFSMRAIAPSLPGLCLLGDAVLRLLCRPLPARGRRIAYGAVCGLMSLVFLFGSLSELHDYRESYLYGERLTDTLTAMDSEWSAAAANAPDGKLKIAVVGTHSATESQNYLYHEHVQTIAASVWSLAGSLTTRYRAPRGYTVTPMDLCTEEAPVAALRSTDAEAIYSYDLYYLYSDTDSSLHPLTLVGDTLRDDTHTVAHIIRDGTRIYLYSAD